MSWVEDKIEELDEGIWDMRWLLRGEQAGNLAKPHRECIRGWKP